MKRLLMFAVAVCLMAQSNPQIGTWKLNLAKSKYNPGPAPKSQTSVVVAAGDGIKNTTKTVAADGSNVGYGYTESTLDGKDYPLTGSAPPSGGDTISVKRIDAYTFESTLKKGGSVVQTTKAVYSKDGKLRTLTTKGTKSGETNLLVYERQ